MVALGVILGSDFHKRSSSFSLLFIKENGQDINIRIILLSNTFDLPIASVLNQVYDLCKKNILLRLAFFSF